MLKTKNTIIGIFIVLIFGIGCLQMDAQFECGNGAQETGEACDDGNKTSGDGCSATCTAEQLRSCSATNLGICINYNGTLYTTDLISADCNANFSGTVSTQSCSATSCVGICIMQQGTPNEVVAYYYSPVNNVTAAQNDCASTTSHPAGVFNSVCP